MDVRLLRELVGRNDYCWPVELVDNYVCIKLTGESLDF